MTDAQLNALWTEITRTAAPSARVIFRTAAEESVLPGRISDALLGEMALRRRGVAATSPPATGRRSMAASIFMRRPTRHDMSAVEHSHAELMDGVYRYQRHVYDLTRKYYLLGRDRLIDGLDVAA